MKFEPANLSNEKGRAGSPLNRLNRSENQKRQSLRGSQPGRIFFIFSAVAFLRRIVRAVDSL